MKALKQCITGMVVEEVTTEYVLDDESGEMKMTNQKMVEKKIPPNPDLIKLIYQKVSDADSGYDKLTDEELEKEKQRLLKMLKENKSGD
ncbi:MAG: hypothetical protein MJ152_03270 [Clostridia bacterium]|nr:hypothetical protein [Clostridia bacterium]